MVETVGMMRRNCSGSLYELLDVDGNATQEQLKKSYYRLALRFHPDKTNGTTTEQFKLIQGAYFVLSDAKKRSIYNRFGKSGLDAFSKLEDMNLPISPSIITFICFMFSIWASLLLLALELVIVRLDYGKQWKWPLVFIPLWIDLLPVLVFGITMIHRAFLQRDIVTIFVGCECLMLNVAAGTFVAGLSGTITWTTALAPSAALCVIDTCRLMHPMIYTVYNHLRGNTDARGSSCFSQAFSGVIAKSIFKTLCLFSFLILAMLRAAQTVNDEKSDLISFWELFAPLIVYFGCMAFVTAWLVFNSSARMTGLLFRLASSLFSTLRYGSLLFMTCMMAAKCEVEQNHKTTGLHPSAAVTLIPLQAMLALIVIMSCCTSFLSRQFLDGWSSEAAGVSGEGTPLFDDGGKDHSTSNTDGFVATEVVSGYKSNKQNRVEEPNTCFVQVTNDSSAMHTAYREV